MNKIKARHTDNDRVICENVSNRLSFWYQPAGSSESYWLFDTDFDHKTYWYFRRHGKGHGQTGNSITLRQIYCFNDYTHRKLTRNLYRIPKMVNYVVNEIITEEAYPAA